MSSDVDFQHLAALCGWKESDDVLFDAFGRVWQNGYYQQFGTVEQLLFNPWHALEFVIEFKIKTRLHELRVSNVLRKLMNLRKANFLRNYEDDADSLKCVELRRIFQ